jgi:predicted RNA-binding protein
VLALTAIHGEDDASQLMPEYTATLVKAGRMDDANEAAQRYLAFRKRQNRPMTALENSKLDFAIDQIMNSKRDCPELIAQLRRVRETGVVTSMNATHEDDDQLAKDLKSLQGKWRYRGWKDGKISEHMIIEVSGDECVTRWLNEENKTIRGRTNRIQLSRNGSAKVFTSYLGGDSTEAASFVYQLLSHQFIIVSAMLENTPSLPEIEMRRFYRMKDGEAD